MFLNAVYIFYVANINIKLLITCQVLTLEFDAAKHVPLMVSKKIAIKVI